MKITQLKSIINTIKNIFIKRIENSDTIQNNTSPTLNDFDGYGAIRYTNEGYIKINKFLWQSDCYYDIDELEEIVKDIIEITSKMEDTEHNLVVFRGTKGYHFPELDSLKPNMEITLQGLTSTSLNLNTAKEFTNNHYDDLDDIKPLVFKINVKKGSKYSRPPHFREFYEMEQEILLPPATYKITHIIKEKNKPTIIELTQKELLDIKNSLNEGLDYVLHSNYTKRSDIHPSQIVELKTKINNYFSQNTNNHTPHTEEYNTKDFN